MLAKLYKNAPKQALTVPEWLIGCWKREYILDNNDGTMDKYCNGTKVIYMQTQSKFIDFRIPSSITSSLNFFINKTGQTLTNPFNNYNNELFDLLCLQLCDSGICNVLRKNKINNNKLSDIVKQGHNIIEEYEFNTNVVDLFTFPVAQWHADINYQLSINYPEAGILTQHETRLNCMYEQPPSNEYLELWKYENNCNGPCIQLELITECDIKNENNIVRRNGRIIIIGNHFMIVRDRKYNCKNIKQLIENYGANILEIEKK
eukprot:318533_1